jgi:hypothetical protein
MPQTIVCEHFYFIFLYINKKKTTLAKGITKLSSIFNGRASQIAVNKPNKKATGPMKGKENKEVVKKNAKEPSTVLFELNGLAIFPKRPIIVE